MPEYLSPGVYVEEVDAGPKPIEGVSTSIGGAVGVTLLGPSDGKPVLVTSFADFTRQFGGSMTEPDDPGLVHKWALDPAEGGRWWYFPLSVKGFFDNGGQELFVKRVFSSDAVASSAIFGQGVDAVLAEDAEAGATELRLEHLFGLDKASQQLAIYANGKLVQLAPTALANTANANDAQITVASAAGLAVNDSVSVGGQQYKITAIDNNALTIDPAMVAAQGANTPVIGLPKFNVASYDAATNSIQLNRPAPQQLKAGRDYVSVVSRKGPAPPPNDTRTLNFTAKSVGAWGDNISVRTAPMVGSTAKILADPLMGGVKAQTTLTKDVREPVAYLTAASAAAPATTLTAAASEPATTLASAANQNDQQITVASAAGLALNDVVSIGGVQYTITAIAAAVLTINPGLAAPQAVNTPVQRLAHAGSKSDLAVEDTAGFAVNDQVTIAGQNYTITGINAANKVLTISPPVPDGPGWPAATPVQGAGKPLQVNDATGFAANDSVDIGGIAFQVASTAANSITLTAPTRAWPLGTEVTRLAASGGSPVISVDDSTNFSVNDRILIGKTEFDIAAKAGNSLTLATPIPDGVLWPAGSTVQRMRPANDGVNATINCTNAAALYAGALLELDNGALKERRTILSITGSELTLDSAIQNKYYEGHKLRVIEVDVQTQYVVNGTVQASEHFTNLRLVNDGTVNYIVNYINDVSTLINVAAEPGFSTSDFAEFPCAPASPPADSPDVWVALANGDDSLDTLSVDDFVGVDGGSGRRTGIQALEDIEQISLCMAPQMWSQTIHDALILHCETLRYRFAILDPQDGLSIEQVMDARSILDTKYAAIYYPWVQVRDPLSKRNVDIAPSGHLMGIYARVDTDRGYYKAPANEVISGIIRISQDVNKREQDLLNPIGINALRFFPDRGYRVWGARTLSSDSSWKYINVRRIFIFVEASIDQGTQWVVFEPNDEPLWARVRQTVGNFLNTVWRSGALQGAKAEDAYFVKCDYTTMTQDDIDNGRPICVIGIAPVKPAEFVIFRIQQMTLEATTV
jgi:phage tail sheath protein FI